MNHELSKTIAVNDIFLPLLENKNRTLVLYGGFGSGKSVFAAQKIIHRVTTEQKHRFLVVRKVSTTIKQSVFKLLTNEIDSRGIRGEFLINKTNESFLHQPTGNEILCEGLDDPEKLKSIVDITSIWFEEPTELTEEEYDKAVGRMRGETPNYKQIILTFNPIDERHWLKKRFFEGAEEPNCHILHTTYKDNFCIDEDYKDWLEGLAIKNPNLYRIATLGEWGKADVQRPYVHNFKRSDHVSDRAKFSNRPVICSIDFNLDPFVCLIAHKWQDGQGEHLHFIKEIIIKNGDIDTMAQQIKATFPPVVLLNALFTGDATGQNRNISQRDAVSNWRLLQRLLNISDSRLRLPRANPSVSGSRNLINMIFATHPDLVFNPLMSLTINELLYTEADEEGNILKKDRSKMEQRADALDCVRYLLLNFYSDWDKRLSLKSSLK